MNGIYARRRKSKAVAKRILSLLLAALVLAGACYVIYAWATRRTDEAGTRENTATISVEREGKDETKPSADSISDYRVAHGLPRVVSVASLGVSARVLPMNINSLGNIQAPENIYDTGWYSNGNLPGSPGAVLLNGHASGPTRVGIFAYLEEVQVGETVELELGGGEKMAYKVTHKETVRFDDVDMKKALSPYNGAEQGLNLITCTGEWVESQKTYDHRTIVYAERG